MDLPLNPVILTLITIVGAVYGALWTAVLAYIVVDRARRAWRRWRRPRRALPQLQRVNP